MDQQRFDEITKGVAAGADRRSVLKGLGLGGLAAAGAAAGVAAFGRAQPAEAALVNVVITNVLNDLTIEIPIKNNNVALQVCAVISDINAVLVDDEGDSVAQLTCTIDQSRGGSSGGQ